MTKYRDKLKKYLESKKISTSVDPVFDKNLFYPLNAKFKKVVGSYYSPFKVKKLLEDIDDLIENFFLRMARGSGLKGLVSLGINTRIKNINLIRPLIKFDKKEKLLPWQYRLNNLIERGLSCNLRQCCKDFDVPFDSSKLHDALYDIRVNYEVFKKMLWEVEI